jgi:hypothetical protein
LLLCRVGAETCGPRNPSGSLHRREIRGEALHPAREMAEPPPDRLAAAARADRERGQARSERATAASSGPKVVTLQTVGEVAARKPIFRATIVSGPLEAQALKPSSFISRSIRVGDLDLAPAPFSWCSKRLKMVGFQDIAAVMISLMARSRPLASPPSRDVKHVAITLDLDDAVLIASPFRRDLFHAMTFVPCRVEPPSSAPSPALGFDDQGLATECERLVTDQMAGAPHGVPEAERCLLARGSSHYRLWKLPLELGQRPRRCRALQASTLARTRCRSGSSITPLLRPVTNTNCRCPPSRAFVHHVTGDGLSTDCEHFLGIAFVAGRKRVPSPATV